MINLRKLKFCDIAYMLEWMDDPDISKNFQFLEHGISEENVKKFIRKSQKDKLNLHYAIVNEKVIGTGVAACATEKILQIAFDELKLNKVYLNVLSENIRAIKFYEKMSFKYEGEFKEHFLINKQYKDIKWYSIIKNKGE